MSEIFEIVIFTASLSQYAYPLISRLDKNSKGFPQLYREHWTFYKGMYFVKDLSKLGRNMKDVIIVDNSPSAYMFQNENAMPIISWYQSKTDRELYKLMTSLKNLASVDDVRTMSINNWRKKSNIVDHSPKTPKLKGKLPETPKTMVVSKSTRILFKQDTEDNVNSII